VPGADSQHLGPPAPSPALLDDALLRELGMLDRATRARRTAQAFVQLLLAPRLTLLRRRSDGDEMQEASPLVDRLALALPAARRSDWRDQAAELGTERKAPTPVARPQPQAAAALPARLSASQVEALRDCPYRFFATAVLRLRSVDELDADADKRLYGNWLHATLKYFHEHRAGLDPVPDTAAAQADFIAAAESAMAGLKMSDDPADAERLRVDLLPFRVGLEALAQRYLEWLAGHEAKSWRFSGGEIDRRIIPVVMGGTALVGRLDRIDSHSPAADAAPVADIPAPRASLRQVAPAARSWLLIDYKTGSAEALKRKVRQPLEDTQLAFYAAISAPALAEGDTLAALYLALDDRDEVKAIVHPDVGESAQALLDGLADEWHRLRAGAAMPALGEGPICEFCDARGLCRRDRWGPA
jgi:ATP-dependent helicase/nuclease subunit B